jgi:hypothetical protein
MRLRLLQVTQRPLRHRRLRIIIHANDVDRDVPRRQIDLQTVQHAPAVEVRQMEVKRDGVRLQFACQRQGRGAAWCDHRFHSFFMREVHEHFCVGEIIFDNQHHSISGHDRTPIIFNRHLNRLAGLNRRRDLPRHFRFNRNRRRRQACRFLAHGPRHMTLRQV